MRLAHALLRQADRLLGALAGWGAFALSAVERGDAVVSVEPGQHAPARLGPRVAVFCHFDGQGRIRPHTRLYVDALCQAGLDVVFVSNAQRLAPPDLAWLGARAARIVLRRNIGYDFAAWRDAMARCGLPAPETDFLLLANDSVYGPFRPLGPLLQQMDFAAADVWGATDSWQHSFHLQSYFVAFGRRALASEAFGRFWRGVRNVRSKGWVVSRYEVGLTRAAIAGDLRCRAVWPYLGTLEALRDQRQQRDLAEHGVGGDNHRPPSLDPVEAAARKNVDRVLHAAARRVPLNPTADLWKALIEQGFPFLKRELLRDNPSQVPDTACWPFVPGGLAAGDRDVILRDLERVSRNRAP